ncbi:hypothetical protein TNCT_104061 [Trichonephila clavata]|uniref:Uncharacterized protein n=1 Tax=Trichonephila clavata TaxID=2740835 RepID=A0A8X6FM16_TRICU|nr:hypothetical protein TNCT_104061 [Trichonephila clavata]
MITKHLKLSCDNPCLADIFFIGYYETFIPRFRSNFPDMRSVYFRFRHENYVRTALHLNIASAIVICLNMERRAHEKSFAREWIVWRSLNVSSFASALMGYRLHCDLLPN